jgi:hypothetical protein
VAQEIGASFAMTSQIYEGADQIDRMVIARKAFAGVR